MSSVNKIFPRETPKPQKHYRKQYANKKSHNTFLVYLPNPWLWASFLRKNKTGSKSYRSICNLHTSHRRKDWNPYINSFINSVISVFESSFCKWIVYNSVIIFCQFKIREVLSHRLNHLISKRSFKHILNHNKDTSWRERSPPKFAKYSENW